MDVFNLNKAQVNELFDALTGCYRDGATEKWQKQLKESYILLEQSNESVREYLCLLEEQTLDNNTTLDKKKYLEEHHNSLRLLHTNKSLQNDIFRVLGDCLDTDARNA